MFVDYRCPDCGGMTEHSVPTPPPRSVACRACGGHAQRVFSAVGLLRGAGSEPPLWPAEPSRTLCRDNPDVPMLCHLLPQAAQTWVARARGDNRTLDRLLERQSGDPSPAGGIAAHSHSSHRPHPHDHPASDR